MSPENRPEQARVESLRESIRESMQAAKNQARPFLEESEREFQAGNLEGAKAAYLRALEIDLGLMFEDFFPDGDTPVKRGTGTVEDVRSAIKEMSTHPPTSEPIPNQEYFWQEEWFNSELEAEGDIEAGRVKRFGDAKEAIGYLKSEGK